MFSHHGAKGDQDIGRFNEGVYLAVVVHQADFDVFTQGADAFKVVLPDLLGEGQQDKDMDHAMVRVLRLELEFQGTTQVFKVFMLILKKDALTGIVVMCVFKVTVYTTPDSERTGSNTG